MRTLLSLSAFVLVLAGLMATADAALSGCFCNDQLEDVFIPGAPLPDIQYFASSICICYENADSFSLQINGSAIFEPKNRNISVKMATCSGVVLYAQPQLAVLTYNAANYCTSSGTSATSFCPWVCTEFSGTYNFLYDSEINTHVIAFAPGPTVPPQSWGGLKIPIKLVCNSSSCGDASGLVPPAPLPHNITVISATTEDDTDVGMDENGISPSY